MMWLFCYTDLYLLCYLLCYVEETENGANPVHDRVVLVRLYANVTVGEYFARMGHVPLRRRESHFQGGPSAAEGLSGSHVHYQTLPDDIRNTSSPEKSASAYHGGRSFSLSGKHLSKANVVRFKFPLKKVDVFC